MGSSSSPIFLHLSLAYLTIFSSFQLTYSSSISFCPKDSYFFLYHLQSQCPSSISPNPPRQVNGAFLDEFFSSNSEHVAVLFYASWCPFSLEVLPAFKALSSIFPQIEHLMIEQSSAMPSVFSRYGIYSLPSILILNRTSKVNYHGAKTFTSLVQFYQRTTGIEPVDDHRNGDQPVGYVGGAKSAIQLLRSLTFSEIVKSEPYLVFSIIFLCLRVVVLIFPEVLSQLKAFWVSHALHFNLQVFGETSQLMGRVLQTIDPRRVWAKLRLSKTRSFHESARNAGVWASTLASVSLGKSSSPGSCT